MIMTESWLKDVTLVVLGWALGLFTLPIIKDGDAKENCLNKLNELKRVLENLSKNMNSPARSEQRYHEYLMQAKVLIEDLNIDHMALLFSSHDLKGLISQSLTIFSKLDPDHQNPAFHVTQTAVGIAMIWNGSKPVSRDFEAIEKIQHFIGRTFLSRFFGCLSSFIKRLFTPKTNSGK